jgi:hypothetical protein
MLVESRMTTVYVDLPEAAQKLYDELENDFITKTGGIGVQASNSAVLQGTLSQLAIGALYTNAERTEWAVLHDEKLDALETHYRRAWWGTAACRVRIPKRLEPAQVTLSSCTKDGNEEDEDDWNRGDGTVPLMLIYPQSAGHGSNLQHGGRNIAWMLHNFNLEAYLKVGERLGVVRQLQSATSGSSMSFTSSPGIRSMKSVLSNVTRKLSPRRKSWLTRR